ncbi:MAG TPA: fused MFS/spermidine synthase [Opitutus sp.]|nr:fused MFS/spermidine synthase [Opitutus sp.]
MFPFAFTIFAGAFLLFAVQPLIGKYILPWFGGGPGVWTTCLLFFQAALLGGYYYAHLIATRLKPRRQVLLHLLLVAVALAFLPIIPGAQWKPAGSADPIGRILLLLTLCIGAPYFILSSTGPLMQQWFGVANPGRSPWRLYALSNTGSLLALLSYPFFFERFFSRQAQAGLWATALFLFAAGCLWCGLRIWRSAAPGAPGSAGVPPASVEPAGGDARAMPPPASAVPAFDRLLWFTLPAVASILLLATTNKLCQDLAVIPFLWVLPLSLYLLSFIICFDHPRWYRPGLFSALFALGALTDVYLLVAGHDARLPQQVAGYTATLFAACMLCHGEVFRLRPAPSRLTSFYLHIAAGGATGAFFVAVVAPLLFDRFLELQIGLWLLSYLVGVLSFRRRSLALAAGTALGVLGTVIVIPALRAAARSASPADFASQLRGFLGDEWLFLAFVTAGFVAGFSGRGGWLREWRLRTGFAIMLFSVALGLRLFAQICDDSRAAVVTSRDFYGVLKVFDHHPDEPTSHYYALVHGVTSHGLQFTEFPQCTWPTSYYGNTSGLGLALEDLATAPRRIGMVGLGTGTVAAYGRTGETIRIYEIDPQVERLARSRFTYLARSVAHVEVVMGDARLSMERELAEHRPQNYDLLALDAFSSDAIPVHLLTVEAFQVYLRHLKPRGVIAVHTSNRYLNLRPVVENIARHLGLEAVTISDDPPSRRWWEFRSTWILVTRNYGLLARSDIQLAASSPDPQPEIGVWTDDHASVYEILK